MKNVLIKGGIVVFSAFIFMNIVITCMSAGKRLEYVNVAELAKKNAELVKPIVNPPGQSYGTADESLLKDDDEPFTAEDFSYMVIDGIRIDMPCTVGDLAEHFGIRYIGGSDYRNQSVLYVCKDDVPFMSVKYDKKDSKPPYLDCPAESIFFDESLAGAFIPEIIVGGINIVPEAAAVRDFQTSGADGKEYVFVKDNLVFETTEGGYVRVDTSWHLRIYFYDSYDEMYEDIGEDDLKKTAFKLLTTEVHLSDTYDPESYEPISLEGMDLSEMDVEIMENPDTCIYDKLLDCRKNGREACMEICNSVQLDEQHVYLEGTIYYENDDESGIAVKAILRDGQELGEALILESIVQSH